MAVPRTGTGAGGTGASTASGRVKEMIREDILKGVLMSGQRVKIADIAARYGVGQMPVREALHQLEGEGLLETFAHRGALIRQIDAKFVYDKYEIRRVLERMLVENAARVVRADDVARLEHAHERYVAAATDGDPSRMLAFNAEFHHIINQIGDNDEAVRILERGWDLIHALRLRFGYGRTRSAATVDEHRELIDALAERNPERAIAVTDRHCRAARDDLLQQLA